MDTQLLVILALTFVIHLIGTLAYAFRIAGIRTGHIAIAFSLFNVLILVSRLSNSFQGPFLAKRVETAIHAPGAFDLGRDFALVLAASSVATLAGGLLIPTLQRYATVAVRAFQRQRSMPRLILRAVSPRGASVAMQSFALPRYQNLSAMTGRGDMPAGVIAMNFVASALWTVGVLSSIYAGVLEPDFRVTASTLSSLVNGVATIMMFILVDPYLSGLTDDVVHGRATDGQFRRVVTAMTAARLAGTLVAQILLVPCAWAIVWIARLI